MREALTQVPQYVFVKWCLVKHSDNFTFASAALLIYSIIGNDTDITNDKLKEVVVACLKIYTEFVGGAEEYHGPKSAVW
jgi:hypothetical protein